MEHLEKTPVEPIDFSNTEVAFQAKTDRQLKDTYRLFKLMNQSWLVDASAKIGLYAVKWNLPFARWVTRKTIYEQFVGGRTLKESESVIEQLYHHKIASILDYGLEAKSDEASFEEVAEQIIKSVDFADKNLSVPVVVIKISAFSKNAYLERVQRGEQLNAKEQKAWSKMMERVHAICSRAKEKDTAVFIDAEESWIQDAIDSITIELMKTYNQERAIVYNTYQLYRHDKLAQLKKDHQNARSEGYFLGAKLVRGAYMEKENNRAEEEKRPTPIQPNKASTDRDYNAALIYCLDHMEDLAFCNATHNMDSVQLMASEIEKRGLQKNHPHLNFCQLYGMSDYITFNLATRGYNVAKYLPYGPVDEVVPYLIRRAQENTSITGEMSRELSLIHQEIKRRGI